MIWFAQGLKQANNCLNVITPTLGRLFTLLWKGDVGVLSEDTPEPKPPLLLQDARQRNVLENIILKFKENNLPEKGFNGKSLFLTACDLTNEVALTNNKTLLYLLEKEFITHNLPIYSRCRRCVNRLPTPSYNILRMLCY